MKPWIRSMLIVGAATAVLVQAVLSFWTPAQAQLGNSGVPVFCSVGVGSSRMVFGCKAADGTAFANNRVPSGYYLHLTDVIIVPSSTADTQAIIESQDGGNANVDSIVLQTSSYGSQGQHYTSPFMVLPAQYRLTAYSFNGQGFIAEVSGLLTRNVTFVPLIAR